MKFDDSSALVTCLSLSKGERAPVAVITYSLNWLGELAIAVFFSARGSDVVVGMRHCVFVLHNSVLKVGAHFQPRPPTLKINFQRNVLDPK